MVITESLVKQFEFEQRLGGTYTAMHNLLWKQAKHELKELGIRSVATTYTSRVRRNTVTNKKGKKRKKKTHAY